MPIGKNKKRLVAYVLNATSEAIKEEANATGKSASKIAGKVLDERFGSVYTLGDIAYDKDGKVIFVKNQNGVYRMGIDPYEAVKKGE